ncbi:antibiotic ABC transporter permease [Halosimplex pelagicum]|uniref:Antibiotic ABC transporter permease n=1 Tax=Halosimplex pelagicum TaxID=869886 RepID=A0A7D5TRC4_9EURY|nr:antibiotic ABC transporter permease [Halosimplex pelagicum]QLH81192.1 antibiotic ABC transporter permease [Halosimplex pelagicum]
MSHLLDARGEVTPDDRLVFERFEQTMAYARTREYTGWDYGDGMDSRLLEALPVSHKWLNIAFQEAAKRSPVNVRPLLGVRQRRNYQGAALFAMANQTAARLLADSNATSERPAVDYDAEAQSLADWLVANRLKGYGGFCAGYPHPIQHLDGLGRPGQPDVINTAFGVVALLRAADYDADYAETVRSAAAFVTENLNYRPVGDDRGAVIDYHTKHEEDYYTINAGAVCARMFAELYAHFDEDRFRDRARELLDHVADLQTDRGGWMYRDPPEASHLSMDNHHNGFIIESFQRYRAVTGDDRYDRCLETALEFYRTELFESTGAPNFDEETRYPRDVHASSQGILVFTYAGDLAFARRILQWTLENLYAGDGAFYFRGERWFTKRVVLMRWCQAWMAYAMSEYLDARLAGTDPSGIGR